MCVFAIASNAVNSFVVLHRVSTLTFVVFMAILTFADVTAVDDVRPESYTRPIDYARAVCEVIVILVLVFSLLSELLEFIEKR